MTTPPIFPSLHPGYSVIKRVKAGSTLVARAGSGRQVRAQLWVYPMWEWDIPWEYLPDFQGSGVTASDFKTLVGMFLAEAGAYGGFLYQDPDENSVTGQNTGTGDGTTLTFTLFKSFGLSSGSGTEPIGYLNQGAAFNVYVNGTLKTIATDYTVDVSTPYAQTITFSTAPGAGLPITVDMSFYYYVHFKDDVYDFENFMHRLWAQKKITLESLRG